MSYLSKEERRSAIVDATVGLVWEKGLGAATVRAVAEAMEASPGQIHHHFRSADELRAEAFREAWRRVTPTLMRDLQALKPLERLVTIVAGTTSEEHALAQHLWRDALASSRMDKDVRQAVREGLDHWRNVIVTALTEAKAQGDVPTTLDEDRIAHRLLALALGLDMLDQVIGHELCRDRETTVREVIESEVALLSLKNR